MARRYEGGEDTNVRRVVRYLRDNYGCTEEQAVALTGKYVEVMERAVQLQSMAYYPGDQIAKAEGLEMLEEESEEEDN